MSNFRKLALFGGCLVLFMLISGCSTGPQDLSELFPAQLQGLELVKLLTGEEAMVAVNKLHSKSIPVEDSAIGHYTGQHGPMTVWISRSSNSMAALEQVALMVEKMMRTPSTPFSDASRTMMGIVEVHRIMGMGQVHLIFAQGPFVYWISVNVDVEEAVLGAFLESH